MSKHLPECHLYEHDDVGHFDESECDKDCVGPCICGRLRACEQRVLEEERDDAQRILIKHGAQQFVMGERMGRTFGYTAGVQAAREAVEAYLQEGTCVDCSHTSRDAEILAAIDALRNDSSDTGTKVQDTP